MKAGGGKKMCIIYNGQDSYHHALPRIDDRTLNIQELYLYHNLNIPCILLPLKLPVAGFYLQRQVPANKNSIEDTKTSFYLLLGI